MGVEGDRRDSTGAEGLASDLGGTKDLGEGKEGRVGGTGGLLELGVAPLDLNLESPKSLDFNCPSIVSAKATNSLRLMCLPLSKPQSQLVPSDLYSTH